MTLDLLARLESSDGPNLYVGTSHRCLNFNTRDAHSGSDRIRSFASASIANDSDGDDRWVYRICYRRVVRQRPTDHWIESDCPDVETAAKLIVDAMAYADVPERR